MCNVPKLMRRGRGTFEGSLTGPPSFPLPCARYANPPTPINPVGQPGFANVRGTLPDIPRMPPRNGVDAIILPGSGETMVDLRRFPGGPAMSTVQNDA